MTESFIIAVLLCVFFLQVWIVLLHLHLVGVLRAMLDAMKESMREQED